MELVRVSKTDFESRFEYVLSMKIPHWIVICYNFSRFILCVVSINKYLKRNVCFFFSFTLQLNLSKE